MLTGRYQFKPGRFGHIVLWVEDYDGRGGCRWRRAKRADLPALEPAVADGWRFPEGRSGTLLCYGDDAGKRIDVEWERHIRSLHEANVARARPSITTHDSPTSPQ